MSRHHHSRILTAVLVFLAVTLACGAPVPSITGPTATLVPTFTPEPTATALPTPKGFMLFEGNGMSLMLPDYYTGGNTTTDLDLILEEVKRMGPDYANMVPQIEQYRESFMFLAYDLTNIEKNNGFANNVLAVKETTLSGISVSMYLDAVQKQMQQECQQCSYTPYKTLAINGYDGGMFINSDPRFGYQTRQVFYVVKLENDFWGVVYTAEGSHFAEYEPTFAQSIQTIKIHSAP